MTNAQPVSGTVLLAGEDQGLLETLCYVLVKEGIPATIVPESAAVEAPGAIVLDAASPSLATEVLGRVRLYPSTPVIVLAAHTDLPRLRAALTQPGIEFLGKPFAMKELLNLLAVKLKG